MPAWRSRFVVALVALGWVLFRAPTLDAALRFYGALVQGSWAATPDWQGAWAWIVLAALLAFAAPNTTQLFRNYAPGLLPADLAVVDRGPAWSPSVRHALALALLLLGCSLLLSRESVFLYFQF